MFFAWPSGWLMVRAMAADERVWLKYAIFSKDAGSVDPDRRRGTRQIRGPVVMEPKVQFSASDPR
jgi:hypothetical protein